MISAGNARSTRHRILDPSAWNDVRFRDDDIVICAYAKSGSTWLQQIVCQLVFEGREDVDLHGMARWVDYRIMRAQNLAAIEAQTHRRFLKSHLSADALLFSPKARYVYVARDGRDVAWSLFSHLCARGDSWYASLNDGPAELGPPMVRPTGSVREFFLDWIRMDGRPFWPYWQHIRTWWQARSQDNVLLLHYVDMKRDLEKEVRRIASFLSIPIKDENLKAILDHCSFDYMKQNSDKMAPNSKDWKGGTQAFFRKGVDGDWRTVLSAEDCALYEETARRELGEECARWLATGERST